MKASKKKQTTFIVVLLLLIIVGIGGLFALINTSIKGFDNPQTKTITIEDNWYGKQVLQYLDEQDVIKNANVDYLYAKIKKMDLNFKAGTYEINNGLSFEEVVKYLSDGTNAIQDTVTIKFIEGYRAKDYADLISKSTNLNYEDIMAKWNDETYVRSLMSSYPFLTNDMFNSDVKCLLEGYLFPNTYEFFRDSSIEDITEKLLDETLKIYKENEEAFIASQYSVHELYTLASIVQRETGNTNDMPLVASVFFNRLATGMQLQSSVTVCYALDIGLNGDWTKCEVIQDSSDPYNTYQIMGFPPGAICNPGKDALLAVLNPVDSDYFFFIGDVCGNGGTIFAKTYGEQLANQKEYLSCY